MGRITTATHIFATGVRMPLWLERQASTSSSVTSQKEAFTGLLSRVWTALLHQSVQEAELIR